MRQRLIPVTLTTLLVTGCGGPMSVAPEDPQNYTPSVTPRLDYASHATTSDIHWWGKSDGSWEVVIGPDVEPREPLRHVATLNGIRYFMGASRDGVGVNRLRNYQSDLNRQDYGSGFFPFIVQPDLVWDLDLRAPENEAILRAVEDSVRILNDALPPEFQLEIYTPRPGYTVGPGDIFVSGASAPPGFFSLTGG